MANDATSASFEKAVASSWMTRTIVNNHVSTQNSTNYVETTDRQVANGIHPVASPTPVVVRAESGQRVEMPFVPLVVDTSTAAADLPQSGHRPPIAVIQLSGSSADDKVLYHEPLNGGEELSQGKQDTTKTGRGDDRAPPPALPPQSTTTSRQQSTAPVNGGGGGGHEQVPESGAKLPDRSNKQAVVSRISNGDSWKRRKAMKLAKRRTAEKEQRLRQISS